MAVIGELRRRVRIEANRSCPDIVPAEAKQMFCCDLTPAELEPINQFVRRHAAPMLVIGGVHSGDKLEGAKGYYRHKRKQQLHELVHVAVQKFLAVPNSPPFFRNDDYADPSLIRDEFFVSIWHSGNAQQGGYSRFGLVLPPARRVLAKYMEDTNQDLAQGKGRFRQFGQDVFARNIVNYYKEHFNVDNFTTVWALYVRLIYASVRITNIKDMLEHKTDVQDMVPSLQRADKNFLELVKHPDPLFLDMTKQAFTEHQKLAHGDSTADPKVLYHQFLRLIN